MRLEDIFKAKAKENLVLSAINTNTKLYDTGFLKSEKPLESIFEKQETRKEEVLSFNDKSSEPTNTQKTIVKFTIIKVS